MFGWCGSGVFEFVFFDICFDDFFFNCEVDDFCMFEFELL